MKWLFVVGIGVAVLTGCTSTEGSEGANQAPNNSTDELEDGEEEVEKDLQFSENVRLPKRSTVTMGHCMRTEEWPEWTLQDWVGSADGVVFGKVVDVAPMDDKGILRFPPEDGGLKVRDASECAKIDNGFVVRLEGVEGYLHDGEVPDEMEMAFGTFYQRMMSSEALARIEEGKVVWPLERRRIAEGMIIGGLVFYNEDLDQWSMAQPGDVPLFEIREDSGLVFQEGDYGESCKVPPFDQLEGLNGEELLALLDRVQFVPRDDRLWSKIDLRIEDMGRGSLWLGLCLTEEELDLLEELYEGRKLKNDAECAEQSDCDLGFGCVGGECRPLDEAL